MSIDELRFKKLPASTTSTSTHQGLAPPATPQVVVQGKAAPNADVVVENKSLAPFAPNDTPDVFVTAKAGPDGRFEVALPAAREGDQLKLRSGSSTVGVRLRNVEAVDGRAPVVRQQGLRLVDDGRGGFSFAHVCKSTVVGEPEQLLQVKNRRTGDTVVLTLDEEGRLAKGARLTGKPGDVFDLATSDGAHNTRFDNGCGSLVAPIRCRRGAPLDEPPPLAGTSASLVPLPGPLFAAGSPASCSVRQGQIGDCWFVSAVDAIVQQRPSVIKDMMKDNGDGTTTVTFRRYDHDRRRYVAEEVTVTNQVYGSRYGGGTAYGSSSTGDSWFPLLEKAYAAWKGGYEGIRSGYPFEAFEALLGAEGRHFDVDVTPKDALFSALAQRCKKGEAIVAWTRVESRETAFANTGLVQDHAYAVLGVDDKGGERTVRIRNPWGKNGYIPAGALKLKGLDSGVIEVPLDAFVRFFGGVGSC